MKIYWTYCVIYAQGKDRKAVCVWLCVVAVWLHIFTCGFSGLWSDLLIFCFIIFSWNKGRGASDLEIDFHILKGPSGQLRLVREWQPSYRHSSLSVFNFFNFHLELLKGVQSSKALNVQIYIIAIGFGGLQVRNPLFLLAGEK